MLHRFKDYIAEHHLIAPGSHVVAGVSGGVDSVVLLDLLHRAGYEVTVCHVNYRLRLPDADEEQAIASNLCTRLDLEFRVQVVEDPGEVKNAGASVQAAARDIRYRFFGEVAADIGAAYIALGHHLDDQAETVLLNLFRGAGPEGLAGMAPSRPLLPGSDVNVVRPLLWARRHEIETYGRERGLPWRVDVSNETVAYRRNVLRNQILPAITEAFGDGVINVIERNASILRAWFTDVLEPALDTWRREAVVLRSRDESRISVEALRKMPGIVQSKIVLEVLRETAGAPEGSFAVAEEVTRLIHAQPGARIVFDDSEVWRERTEILVRRRSEQSAESGILIQPGEEVTLGSMRVAIRHTQKPDTPKNKPQAVDYLDANLLEFPLQLRRWQHGDAFQPLGCTYQVKLSDFLTDARVLPSRKQDILVLETEGTICCIPGLRIDHRFRLTERTVNVLQVEARAKNNSNEVFG